MRLIARIIAAVLAATSPAHAEWRQVRTDHFVLTIDDTEAGARAFATRLERFDSAMRRLYEVSDTADRLSRPITIYALKSDVFNRACGCPGTLGFYRQRAEGSFVFSLHMPDVDRKSRAGSWSSQTVLLHEYSHHFTFSNFPIAYPYWFAEGFAEFNANVSFEDDGSIIVGYPANYRAEALEKGGGLSPKRLFDPHRYGFADNIGLVYGRGWLLTHYLMLHPRRKGQLASYLDAMNKGNRSLVAAERAFGDLDDLNAELDAYRRGELAPLLRIPPEATPPKVAVTALSPGRAEMLPVHLLTLRGVAKGYRMGIALRASRIAARHPGDAVVQAQWAETELMAGRLDKADEAADRALALQPDMIDALVRKGMIAVRRAAEAKTADAAAWTAARGWFLKANRVDADAVTPLYHYYLSFGLAKVKPTPGAIKGLMRAHVLAPESDGIRVALGRQMLADGDGSHASAVLQPIAFEPHLARKKNVMREVVDLIDAGKLEEARAAMTNNESEKED